MNLPELRCLRNLTTRSCGDDFKCFVWDTNAGTCLKVLKDHTQDIYGLAISPDAKYYATASMDEWLYVYSVEVRSKSF